MNNIHFCCGIYFQAEAAYTGISKELFFRDTLQIFLENYDDDDNGDGDENGDDDDNGDDVQSWMRLGIA